MRATKNVGAAAPGRPAPERVTSDAAHGANVGRANGHNSSNSADSRGLPHGRQAHRLSEGEAKAAQYLARLHAQQADPDELALIVAALYGATLRGFCRAIVSALWGRHA